MKLKSYNNCNNKFKFNDRWDNNNINNKDNVNSYGNKDGNDKNNKIKFDNNNWDINNNYKDNFNNNDNNRNTTNNTYSCSGPPAFKIGNCRVRFSELRLCYKQNLPISDINYVNNEY